MKTYLIIFILFVSFKGIGQNSFPDSNAIWNVNHLNSAGTPTDEMLYGLKGDTLINDTLYDKLYTLSDTTLSDESLQIYIGGFRQEGQKVWFKPAYWTYHDILLYDFSASIGDTIWHKGVAYNEFNFTQHQLAYSIIQAINTENGTKTYSIIRGTDGLSGEWYENIGSNFGLFGSIIQFPLVGDTYNLACFKHNDTVKYQNNLQCNRCFCQGGVYSKSKNVSLKNEKRLVPNPCSSYLTISNCALSEGNELLKVIDLNGRVVKQVYISSVPFSLDLSDLQAGHYLVEFPFEEGSREQLIVVND